MTKEIGLDEIEEYIKALHCPIRWDIIKVLRGKPKTSNQIFKCLKQSHSIKKISAQGKDKACKGMCLHANYTELKKPTLYYHLRELESAGIIEGKKLRDERGNILKKKQWELTVKSLKINLTSF